MFSDEVDNFVSYTLKPQLKTVGPKFGKQLGEIRNALSAIDGDAAKRKLDSDGAITLNLPSGNVTLETADILIEAKQKEGFYTVSDRGITVALDTNLTDELIKEGFTREVVSKVQTMRKEAGFNVTDHIIITVSGDESSVNTVLENCEAISEDTLANSITAGNVSGYTKTWDINGSQLEIGVQRV